MPTTQLLLAGMYLLLPHSLLHPDNERAERETASKEASGPSEGVAQFPDTAAGRRAHAFIEAFNSNDPNKVRSFETTHRASSGGLTTTTEERIAQAKQLYADWGRLEVVDVIADGEQYITVVARATGSGDGLEMEFVLEDDSPHQLLYIQIALSRNAMPTATSSPTLDGAAVRDTIETVARELESNYVYPKTGTKMAEALRASLAAHEYDDVTNATVLAGRLTKQLQGICEDKHLRVRVGGTDGGDPDDDEWWARTQRENFGFVKAERLPGNIGYVKLNQFHPSDEAKQVAGAAMNFIAHTDALIFDLRNNGGGSPEMISFLSGYLFDKPIHLNSFYYRPTDSTSETWSDAEVPGIKYGQTKPVYVLTSQYTFSGAEEFTYNLKNLKRATIIGETTGGGAHPVRRQTISDHVWMTVPYARAINPITKTNWEGVGVKPDVAVATADALDTAQELALKTLGKDHAPSKKTGDQ